jgi:ABC-type branched-subunit amino acid transport system substrate-binding protein
MTRPLRHSFLLLLHFCLLPVLHAQEAIPYHPDAETAFESALQDYRAESYYSAAAAFQDVIQSYPLNQRTTAAYIMAARSHLFAGAPQRGLRLLEEFRDQFPQSEYVAESWLISGDGSAAAQSPARAIICYLRAWESGLPDTTLLASRLRALGKPELSAYDQRMVRGYLTLLPSEERLAALIGLHDGSKADTASETKKSPDTMEASQSTQMTVRSPAIIAVALPEKLSDPGKARLVSDIKRGMEAAWKLLRDSVAHPVHLQFYDSSDEPAIPALISALESDPRVLALLAGAFSSDARAICEVAGERDLPVLLPTATEDSLTRYGRNILQLNTPMEERARLLADFASLELDAAAAAVLAPDESWPRSMADAFVQRANYLGLPVTDVVFYESGEEDIADACMRLKKRSGAKTRILFAPVRSRGDIAQVLKGAERSGCSGTILGAGNWNHPDLLISFGGDLTVYFESDVAPDSSCVEMRMLCRELGLRSSAAVSAEVLFGYDAMHLALMLADSRSGSRQQALRRLRTLLHQGLRAPVDLRDSRVNSALNVLRYRDGRVQQLESFHAR